MYRKYLSHDVISAHLTIFFLYFLFFCYKFNNKYFLYFSYYLIKTYSTYIKQINKNFQV